MQFLVCVPAISAQTRRYHRLITGTISLARLKDDGITNTNRSRLLNILWFTGAIEAQWETIAEQRRRVASSRKPVCRPYFSIRAAGRMFTRGSLKPNVGLNRILKALLLEELNDHG